MGRRNRGFSDEQNNTLAASVTDALLFTTMCIIGLPVDVHVRDGSVFSGIFYTACVDDDYAIVLKKARMIKKGNQDASVVNGSLVETLVVQAEDLVQVVAKGVPLPADGIFGDLDQDDVVAPFSNAQFPDDKANATKHNEANVDTKQGQARRLAGDELNVKQSHDEEKAKYEGEKVADALHGSSPERNADLSKTDFKALPSDMSSDGLAAATVELDDQSHEMHSLRETSCTTVVSHCASTDAPQIKDVSPEPRPSSSSTSTESILPKTSSCNRPSKESKLNPGAKIFSPSLLHNRSGTLAIPLMPTVAYIPDSSSVVTAAATEAEYGISPYAPCSSMPVKVVQYNNLIAGNGCIEPQYGHSVLGHSGNRIQPVRYAGSCHHSQASPAFVHPNSQNVMVGRMGALVYMHPLAHDVQSTAPFSQVSARPMLSPYQVYLPKHQGSAAAHALQLCMTPPVIAGGQLPHVMPGHSPISPPPFPVIHPISGPNGFLSTKLA